jgi:hypothetical protein
MKKVFIFIVAIFFLNYVNAEAKVDCEINATYEAEAARHDAEKEAWKHQSAVGAATGVGCMIFLVAAIVDGGMSAILCAATAAAVATSSVNKHTFDKVYNDTYKEIKNEKCKKNNIDLN